MYAVISFSHKNVGVALREKLHFNDTDSIALLKQLNNIDNVLESMLLATCNRCEIYAYLQDSDVSKDLDSNSLNHYALAICAEMITKLANFKGIDKEILQNNAHIVLQSHAVHHVFSVASSLMSVVIGETQISGQMKAAYKLSYDNNLCAKALTRLLHFAFRCAAQVRTLTDISKNPVSVASIAVNLGLEYLEKNLQKANILVVGVGEMGLLCLKNLVKHDVNLTLCNRTKSNAQELLKTHDLENFVSILDFTLLQTHINEYDIVFFAVAGGIILTHEMLQKLEKKRIFFDLSIPRNLAFDTTQLRTLGHHNIEVIDVDDLKSKAATHINARKESAQIAMGIVGQFVLDFEHWLSGLGVNPVIKAMREQAKLASYKEINRAIKKGYIPEALRNNIEKLLHSAFNEFLHAPTMKIKAMADDERSDSMLEAIANVFGAQDKILLNRYKCEYDTTKQ
ncbi:Glutamyl-tRNA reductase HemA [Helicobacter trogontum]|uniref:Glutamyl-tRNA reductase n=1 Tax=Helicobacter trogontum TaxID=50960 RepID=A0ABQ0D0W9_9HELI|nr:glutamyl-tRNA reductase [Helicobacter trogontum]